MTWADTQAVTAIIQTVPALATATYVTTAPKPVAPAVALPLPYCLVHPSEGIPEATRFTGPPITEHPEYTLHIVGGSANQVQVVTGLIKAKFLVNGFIVPPTVAGRRNKSGYWRSPMPIQTDSDVTPALIFQVIEFGWTSDPA